MQLPFTVTQFVGVFARYNAAIGPLPLVAYGLAIASVFFAARPRPGADRFIGLSLASLWAFTGIGYHLMSFSAINPAAKVFGVAFVVQATLLAITSLRGRLRFRVDLRDFRSRMGLVMVTFAAIVYPLVGAASGHGYPNGPVFGLTPCPLVIFTFGMLLMSERSLPKYLVIVPLAWALIGSTAAFALGIREDTGLLVTGARNRRAPCAPVQPGGRARGRARHVEPAGSACGDTSARGREQIDTALRVGRAVPLDQTERAEAHLELRPVPQSLSDPPGVGDAVLRVRRALGSEPGAGPLGLCECPGVSASDDVVERVGDREGGDAAGSEHPHGECGHVEDVARTSECSGGIDVHRGFPPRSGCPRRLECQASRCTGIRTNAVVDADGVIGSLTGITRRPSFRRRRTQLTNRGTW